MADVNLIPEEYKKRKKGLADIFSKIGGVILALLILALLLYAGLLFYKNNLNQELASIEQEIDNLNQRRDPEMEKTIVDLDKKLKNLKEIFESHSYWSELFNKIETLTIAQVYFSETKINFLGNEIALNLSGNGLSYTILARQLKSFQEESLVEKVEISGIALSTDGGIDFDLEVIFSKDILLK